MWHPAASSDHELWPPQWLQSPPWRRPFSAGGFVRCERIQMLPRLNIHLEQITKTVWLIEMKPNHLRTVDWLRGSKGRASETVCVCVCQCRVCSGLCNTAVVFWYPWTGYTLTCTAKRSENSYLLFSFFFSQTLSVTHTQKTLNSRSFSSCEKLFNCNEARWWEGQKPLKCEKSLEPRIVLHLSLTPFAFSSAPSCLSKVSWKLGGWSIL